MAKYINPNQNAVSIDMGVPTRRTVQVLQYGTKTNRVGYHTVIELDPAKARAWVQMGSLCLAPDQTVAADLDMVKLEADAAEAEKNRQHGGRRAETSDETAARAQKETDFRAAEQRALAAEAAKKARLDGLRAKVRSALLSKHAMPIPSIVERVVKEGHLDEASAARLVDEVQGEIDAGGATADHSAAPARGAAQDEAPARDALAGLKSSQPTIAADGDVQDDATDE